MPHGAVRRTALRQLMGEVLGVAIGEEHAAAGAPVYFAATFVECHATKRHSPLVRAQTAVK